MSKFTAALLAAAPTALMMVAPTMAAPAIAAPSHGQSHTQQPSKDQHPFRKGEKFDRNRASHYQVVDYRKYRNVKAPPKGYHYVRSGNDLLLVGVTSGLVAAVTSDMFR